jgi:TM2 domain-containing membrane protein YozV
MTAVGFGRKGPAPSADLAARRAAFLAAERARAQQPGGGDTVADFHRPSLESRRYAPPKSTGMAYLLWLFLGGLSGHRFYLGFSTSAIVQLLLTPIGYAMLLSKSPGGMIPVIAGALWLLADAALIPGMVNRANARRRGPSLASTFD